MQCPECENKKIESKPFFVEALEDTIHIDRYTDSNNKEHIHDTQSRLCEYICSQGHNYITKGKTPCWCGYENQEVENYGR